MQTFLPYPSFAESARCLDSKRLGKQRVEVLQILNAIQNPDAKGWKNHPATKMWRGYEPCLIRYGVAICDEWCSRGFSDTCREKIMAKMPTEPDSGEPTWLGDDRVHSSHRSNLLRKDVVFYGKYGWTDDPSVETFWPI